MAQTVSGTDHYIGSSVGGLSLEYEAKLRAAGYSDAEIREMQRQQEERTRAEENRDYYISRGEDVPGDVDWMINDPLHATIGNLEKTGQLTDSWVAMTPEDNYLDYVPGRDPGYAGDRAQSLKDMGEQAWASASGYGNLISDTKKSMYETGQDVSGALEDYAGAGVDALEGVADTQANISRTSAERLTGIADAQRATGQAVSHEVSELANDYTLGAQELAQGRGDVHARQLDDGTRRALSAQRALAGTVRGTGAAGNTAMEDAMLESNAVRQKQILDASQERAFRDRTQQMTAEQGMSAVRAQSAAGDLNQQGFVDAGATYGQAADAAMGGASDQLSTLNAASGYGAKTYGTSVDIANTANENVGKLIDESGRVRQAGGQNMLTGGVKATGVFDMQQRAGMKREDELVKKVATAKGVAAADNARNAREQGSIIQGISSGFGDIVTHIGSRD